MVCWLRRNYLALIFTAINLAMSAPLAAALDNDTCLDPGGDLTPCCTTCLIFCHCDLD